VHLERGLRERAGEHRRLHDDVLRKREQACSFDAECYNRCGISECWIEGHDATSKGECTNPAAVVINPPNNLVDGRVFNSRIVDNFLPGPFLGRNPGPAQKGAAIQIAPPPGRT
jgi:hypothetical protein